MSILFTGSYNTPVLTGDGSVYQGSGNGIVEYFFDEEKGTLEEKRRYTEAENASWLAFSPDREILYAVNELDDYENTKGGALSAYAVGADGELTLLNRLAVMGAAPCHVNCSEEGKAVFTANYNGGSASIFRTREDGGLKEFAGQISHVMEQQNSVKRRNPVRQEKPHVHSVTVHGEWLWITDLGLDRIEVYHLNGNGMPETEKGPFEVIHLPVGSGPRSIAIMECSGKKGDCIVYVTCELSNEIAVLGWKDDCASLIELVSCLPDRTDAEGEAVQMETNTVGGVLLSPDGRYLYAGNRGHNSIAVFAVNKANETCPEGRIHPAGWISSGGSNPRGFQISPSGRWLLAANQDSNNLVVFQRDTVTGLLEQRHCYEAGAVVCLEFG